MAFRTGAEQWMKLSNLARMEEERQMKREQDIIKQERIRKENIKKAFQKRRRPIEYWIKVNGWRFIRWQ